MSKRKYFAGEKLEMFTLLHKARNRRNEMQWVARCDCGKEKFVEAAHLASGRKKSCGCSAGASRAKNLTTHGKTGTRTYNSWAQMVKRCHGLNPDPHYAKLGITVCEEWRSFSGFYADMGERPEETSIDRIDGRLGYFPGNCRWADSKTQARNKLTRIVLTESKVLEIRRLQGVAYYKDVARMFGICEGSVHAVWRGTTWPDVPQENGRADAHRRDSIKRGIASKETK